MSDVTTPAGGDDAPRDEALEAEHRRMIREAVAEADALFPAKRDAARANNIIREVVKALAIVGVAVCVCKLTGSALCDEESFLDEVRVFSAHHSSQRDNNGLEGSDFAHELIVAGGAFKFHNASFRLVDGQGSNQAERFAHRLSGDAK